MKAERDYTTWGFLLLLILLTTGAIVAMLTQDPDGDGMVTVLRIDSKPYVCPHCGKAYDWKEPVK